MIRVLVVDDDEDLAALIAVQLGRLGFETACAFSVEQAKARARGATFDALVTDYQLFDGEAADVVAVVPARARLLLAGTEGLADQGFDRVLLKPVTAAQIAEAIRASLAATA